MNQECTSCFSFNNAVLRCHYECVKKYYNPYHPQNVNKSETNNRSYLHHMCYAVDNEYIKIMEFLLLKGADPNIVMYNDHSTPLHSAASNGCTKQLSLLLEYGAELDAKDKYMRTPLMCAIIDDNLKGAEILLRSGANINAQDEDGNTLLHHAAMYCSIENIKFLLDNGADTHTLNNKGQTAYAIDNSNINEENEDKIENVKNFIESYGLLDIKKPSED